MVQGTTPTHRFYLPFSTDTLKEVMVIYAQNNEEIFHKDTAECTVSENQISLKLTQEETFLFKPSVNVQIQVRVLKTDGEAYVSQIMHVSVAKCLNSEVMS